MDTISETRLGEVMPELASRVRQLAERLEQEGITIRVTQGLRSIAEQNALYAQGRTEAGRVVTNAQGTDSWHCLGCACDVAPFDDGIPDWNVRHPAWKRIVEVATSLGLVDGISWKDEPHIELTGKYPPKPTPEVKALYEAGGYQAVWNAITSV